MPVLFFTAIQPQLCSEQRGKGWLPGGCFQAKALDLLRCTAGCLARSDESQACLLLAGHSLCKSQTAGTVPCQDSSAARELHRIIVTFLHVKDHQLFFTYYSVLSVFMETTAKEKERKRLFVLSSIQSAHWAAGRCKSPHMRLIHLLHGCGKASGNRPRPVIRDSFWQHLSGGQFWSHSKPRKHSENTKKPSLCSNVANTCTVSHSGKSHCIGGKALQWLFVVRRLPRAPINLGSNMRTEVWWGLSYARHLQESWISTAHMQEMGLIWPHPSESPQ